jgi:3-phenylpropionate/trans-cinnamate dioxygenase ferredoxin reductase subunit
MSKHQYLILGGGMVAGYAAKELVERGLKPGQLTIVSADDTLPYERPPLSKGYLAGEQDLKSILIGDEAFYEDHGTEVRLSTRVGRVDLENRKLQTDSGDTLNFGKLVIATGAHARHFPDLRETPNGLYYLRSVADSSLIRDRSQGAKQAAVIGGGFIGMEVASVLARKGVETTLALPEERVWERFFTPEMSGFFEKYYEDRGVRLLRKARVSSISEAGKRVRATLKSDDEIEADLIVAGIGAVPATELFEGAGLRIDHGIAVNEYLETGIEGVWAAGDVTNYHDVVFGRNRHTEHWDNAVEQGKHVARALTGDRAPFVHLPYFFSDVFDLSYEFWGDPSDADRVAYRGNLAKGEFSVWWLKDSRLRAAFVMRRPEQEREWAMKFIQSQEPVESKALEDESRKIG